MKPKVSLLVVLVVVSAMLVGCFGMKVPVEDEGDVGEEDPKVVGHVIDAPGKDTTEVLLTLAGESVRPWPTGEFAFTDVPDGTHELIITVPGPDDSEIKLTQMVDVSGPKTVVEVVLAGEVELVNPGFEESEPGSGVAIPGWKPGGWNWSASRSFEKDLYGLVSDERAFEGTQSFKLEGFRTEGVTMNSLNEPHPAIPGFVYTASAHAYSDTTVEWSPTPYPMLYIGFFDENNSNADRSPKRATGASDDNWESLQVSLTAPENAKTVAVFVSTNTNYNGVSYWDDFKLTFSRP